MEAHEIEVWARQIIDKVKRGEINEDSRVEFKAEWPTDFNKAARRLAGHANASSGDKIIWLIGVDQKKGVVGVTTQAEGWYSIISKEFNEETPQLIKDLNISVDEKNVVALIFSTDRRPYAVVNSFFGKCGAVEFEIPWRENTAVRTAKRSEVLTILSPKEAEPSFELFNPILTMKIKKETDLIEWQFEMMAYIIPKTDRRLAIPIHTAKIEIEIPNIVSRKFCQTVTFSTDQKLVSGFGEPRKYANASITLQATPTELIVDGPGKFTIKSLLKTKNFEVNPFKKAIADANIFMAFKAAGSKIPFTREFILRADIFDETRNTIAWIHPYYIKEKK